jgi:sugar/nucleoside kinase (ribokinase family)
VVFGDVIDDLIVTPVGEPRPDTDTTARIERRDGGSAANAAAWFGRLGHDTHFFGHVNASDVARHGSALSSAGVTPHLVGVPQLPTGTIVVILQSDRTRTMLTERGANALTSARDIDRSLLTAGGHLHFTAYSLFSDTGDAAVAEFASLVAAARAKDATVSVNPGSAGFLADHGTAALFAATEGATVIIPNLDEGRALTGSADPDVIADALLERYEIVALTLGREGALAAARSGARERVPALRVDPLDTTGAGDAFSAAFVSALLGAAGSSAGGATVSGATLRSAAGAGVAAAATAIQQVGARP